MLKNYLKIAWRNLVKNKGYSLVSALGLSLGVACCILVGLYVYHELSYESHHEKAKRIYRVTQHLKIANNEIRNMNSSSILPKATREQMAEIPNAARLSKEGNTVVKYKQFSSFEDGVYYTEPSVFDLFTISFIKGDPETALSNPGTVVISRKMADKYFEDANPMGKTLSITDEDEEILLTVTGIIENPPSSTEFPFHFLANPKEIQLKWDIFTGTTNYVLLKPNADVEHLEKMMLELTKSNTESSRLESYTLERLDRIHLYSDISSTGDIRYIYIFSIVAFFLLLIANINHINLSIAQFIPRIREVGIRKTLGAKKSQLSFQYLTETFLLSMASILLALFLVELAGPWVNSLPGITLASFSLLDPVIWIVLILLALFITLVSGSYMTFYLARLKPASIFQKSGTQSPQRSYLQKGLIIFQFAVSITLICSTLVVQDQLDFIMESRLGFDKEHVVMLDLNDNIRDQYQVLKEKIEGLSSVKKVVGSDGTIGTEVSHKTPLGEDSPISNIFIFTVSRDFIPAMEIEALSGDIQNLSGGDVVLNASAAEKLNISEAKGQPVHQISGLGMENGRFQRKLKAIVRDFHFQSLRNEIPPLLIQITSNASLNTLNIRLHSGAVERGLEQIRTVWNEVLPTFPMQYSFLDNRIEQMYRSDRRFAKIFWGFSLVTIGIACMGLFGLSSLMAKRRQKEIGIRKVLGATISGVITLLSKDFLKLVVLGFVIAVPIAWYAMNKWLADFAYRIELGPGIFALAGTVAILIALTTVSWQSVQAALANPAESLRSE